MRDNRTKAPGPEQLLPLSEARTLLDIVYVINAILQNNGNLSSAARELQIGRRTLYDMMEKYGISIADGKLSIEFAPFLHYVELQAPCLVSYME